MLFGRAPLTEAGQAIRLYCTCISHEAGIRSYPSRALLHHVIAMNGLWGEEAIACYTERRCQVTENL